LLLFVNKLENKIKKKKSEESQRVFQSVWDKKKSFYLVLFSIELIRNNRDLKKNKKINSVFLSCK
jgi:hypothetical protein